MERKRHEEVAHPAAKEEDAMSASAAEAQDNQLTKLKQQIRELQMRHRSLELQFYRREWCHCACLRESDALARKYKQQLSLAAEGEWLLEQSKRQARLDQQQLCERNQHQKSEDVRQSLSAGRGQIFQHADESSLSKAIATLELQKLQEENANLRAAIAQMRREMESLAEQMLPSLPLTDNRQLAEQGSLSTNNIAAAIPLSSSQVSSPNSDCVVNPGTEKGPNPKVLEEKLVDLGAELPAAGAGAELQCCVSCTLQGMQTKLKEAARKISVLSQEKQQLMEMGNRLRAGHGMGLKEGLWPPANSKCCTVCVPSASLFPKELVKRTQCQLSALKQLQHRLTAQVQLDFSVEDPGPEQQKADPSPRMVAGQPLRQSPGQLQLSSCRAHHFCQGVWQTSAKGSSPSSLSPPKNTEQVEFEGTRSTEQCEESQQNIKAKDELEMPAAHLTVRGARLEVQQKLKPGNLSLAPPVKPKISSKVAKIRNYNIKD